ncbi:MAG: hypothetical protein J6D52_10265 [Clostridia bacterium]|nr:hypothetical protein [Clostridia bacterium]
MKRILTILIMLCSLLLTACNNASIGVIGGADGPTSIIVSEKNSGKTLSYTIEEYFRDNYVDERKLPVLDIAIENPFVSDDRTLILDDSIENGIELRIYEYYHSIMSGNYQEAKNMIIDESLLAATEADENNFKEGIYYSRISIDEIDLVDKDDLNEISNKNKQDIVEMLVESEIEEFAIVEVEKKIKHNEKSLSMAPQVGDGEVTRYFLLGKKDGSYKIIEVYWEGFMND